MKTHPAPVVAPASLARTIAGWPVTRMALGVACVGLGLALAQLLVALLRQALALHPPLPAPFVALEILLAVLATSGAYAAYVRRAERRPVAELSLRRARRDVGLGIIGGGALMTVVIGVLWLLGVYRPTGATGAAALLPALAADVPSAVVQQVLFQGVIFRLAERAVGTRWALLITVALFAALHLVLIPHLTVTGLAAVALGGLLFSSVYLRTHSLWVAMGLHAALDVAQDGIFGVGTASLSGTPTPGLVQAHLVGPALLTGGAAGVEASVVTLAAVGAASAYLLVGARRPSSGPPAVARAYPAAQRVGRR